MDIFILIGIVLVNVIAILIVYHFIKQLNNKQKIVIIAMGIAFNYILVMIVYALSSIGMDTQIAETANSFITFIFVPINTIMNVPFLASSYCRYLQKKLTKQKMRNRIIIVVLVTLVIMVLEYFYFQSIQAGVAAMLEK